MNQAQEKSNKYFSNSKIQRNKILAGDVKTPHKHKIVKENIIRASAESNRDHFGKDTYERMNITGSKAQHDKDNYYHIVNEMERPELQKLGSNIQDNSQTPSMPMVIQNRPSTNIYGTVKNLNDKSQKLSVLGKSKEKAGINAHPHFMKKGSAGRNILKAKMEVRTHSDSQGDEYNFILKNDQHNLGQKFISRNDPYQNALSDKVVVRTSSEKRVSDNRYS